MTRTIILIASLILVFISVPALADNETSTYQQQATSSLRGLHGVGVGVEIKNKSPITLEQHGVTKDQIQTDTEIKLRTAGIKVLSKDELLKEPGHPFLLIFIIAKYHPVLRAFLISITVELIQRVQLERAPNILNASSTWTESGVALISKGRVQNIRGSVKNYVDEFINAYLTENPKK